MTKPLKNKALTTSKGQATAKKNRVQKGTDYTFKGNREGIPQKETTINQLKEKLKNGCEPPLQPLSLKRMIGFFLFTENQFTLFHLLIILLNY